MAHEYKKSELVQLLRNQGRSTLGTKKDLCRKLNLEMIPGHSLKFVAPRSGGTKPRRKTKPKPKKEWLTEEEQAKVKVKPESKKEKKKEVQEEEEEEESPLEVESAEDSPPALEFDFTRLRGPVSVHHLYSRETKQHVVLFGDRQDRLEFAKNDAKGIGIVAFLNHVFDETDTKKQDVDFYLETSQDPTKRAERIKQSAMAASYLDEIRYRFQDLFHPELVPRNSKAKAKAKTNHVRYLAADPGECLKGWYETKLQLDQWISWQSKQKRAIRQIRDEATTLGKQTIQSFLADQLKWSNECEMDTLLKTIPKKRASMIRIYFQDQIKLQVKQLTEHSNELIELGSDPTKDRVLEIVSERDKFQLVHQQLGMTLCDFYTVARIVSGGANSILYVGENRVQNMLPLFYRLGFGLVFRSQDNGQYLDISSLKWPLFSDTLIQKQEQEEEAQALIEAKTFPRYVIRDDPFVTKKAWMTLKAPGPKGRSYTLLDFINRGKAGSVFHACESLSGKTAMTETKVCRYVVKLSAEDQRTELKLLEYLSTHKQDGKRLPLVAPKFVDGWMTKLKIVEPSIHYEATIKTVLVQEKWSGTVYERMKTLDLKGAIIDFKTLSEATRLIQLLWDGYKIIHLDSHMNNLLYVSSTRNTKRVHLAIGDYDRALGGQGKVGWLIPQIKINAREYDMDTLDQELLPYLSLAYFESLFMNRDVLVDSQVYRFAGFGPNIIPFHLRYRLHQTLGLAPPDMQLNPWTVRLYILDIGEPFLATPELFRQVKSNVQIKQELLQDV